MPMRIANDNLPFIKLYFILTAHLDVRYCAVDSYSMNEASSHLRMSRT